MNSEFKDKLRKLASEAVYSESEIAAGIEFSDRKARRSHPPGSWDNAKRFFAAERTQAVTLCRSPSRAWPFSEMSAARTAAHRAEVYRANSLTHVRRIGSALDKLAADETEDAVRRLLSSGMRKRMAEMAQNAT